MSSRVVELWVGAGVRPAPGRRGSRVTRLSLFTDSRMDRASGQDKMIFRDLGGWRLEDETEYRIMAIKWQNGRAENWNGLRVTGSISYGRLIMAGRRSRSVSVGHGKKLYCTPCPSDPSHSSSHHHPPHFLQQSAIFRFSFKLYAFTTLLKNCNYIEISCLNLK